MPDRVVLNESNVRALAYIDIISICWRNIYVGRITVAELNFCCYFDLPWHVSPVRVRYLESRKSPSYVQCRTCTFHCWSSGPFVFSSCIIRKIVIIVYFFLNKHGLKSN